MIVQSPNTEMTRQRLIPLDGVYSTSVSTSDRGNDGYRKDTRITSRFLPRRHASPRKAPATLTELVPPKDSRAISHSLKELIPGN